MSRSIWTRCAGDSEIAPLACAVHRVVESQTVVSTRKLVDSDDEQALLEALLDDVKPAAPRGARFVGLHYLLSTPFRHPPLRHGSRFGRPTARGLFYGSLALDTALAEVAYYRFLFLSHSAARLPLLVTELLAFRVPVRTRLGVDLTAPAFAAYDARLHSPSRYDDAQAVGDAMRASGVEVFLFRSARDPARGKNVGLFEPAFARKKPSALLALACVTSATQVEVASRSAILPRSWAFARKRFEIRGALPDPGRGPRDAGAR